MTLTCDSCRHSFDVSEGAAALGDVSCPKCRKPVAVGGPKDNAIELSGGFEDFFEVESNTTGGFSDSAGQPSAPQAKSPQPPESTSGPTPPAAKPPAQPVAPPTAAPPKPGASTNDDLLADFGDFDSLFDKAEKTETVTAAAPPPAVSSEPKKDAAPTVDDLLADFDLGEDTTQTTAPPPQPPAAPKQAPPSAPTPPAGKPPAQRAAPPAAAPPTRSSGVTSKGDIDDLLDDFMTEQPKGAPPSSSVEKTMTSAQPSESVPQEVSRPDASLEELFSEVSERSEDTMAPAPEEGSGEALASGLGIEYKSRRKKIPKPVLIAVPSLILLIGVAAVGMARFTSSGFFGWQWGQKPADGYEAPDEKIMAQLNSRYQAASDLIVQDNAEGYKKAIVEFRAILKTDIRHSPTDVRLAETLLRLNGNTMDNKGRNEIENLVKQSETHHPGIIEALRAKSRMFLGLGNLSQAESLARRALTLNKNDYEAMVLLGEIAISRTDWEDASKRFSQALDVQPKLPRAQHFLAVVRNQQGNVKEAEAIFRTLVGQGTPHPISEIELWRLLYSHYGQVDEARTGLDNLLRTKEASLSNYDAGRAWRYLAEIAEAGKDINGAIVAMERAIGKDPLNHANGFQLGRLYLDRGEFAKAEQQFGRASSLSPNTPEYLIFRGQALRELNKLSEAQAELNKGLEKATGNVRGLYQLGLVQEALDQSDEAIASLENALKNDSRHVKSMIALGKLYLTKDNFTMAQTQLRTAINIEPNSGEAHNALGEVFLATRKADKALLEFQTANKMEELNATVLANLGRAHLALGNMDKASDFFNKALSVDSTRLDTQVALGELLHRKKEYTKALETYRRVLDTVPKDYDTRVKLSKVLIDQEAFRDAVEQLQEASKYKPNFYPTLLNLGIAWRGLGNLDASLDELQRAVQLRPTDREGSYQLELTHIFRNDPTRAEKAMENALQADPRFIDPLVALGDYFFGRNLYEKAVEQYLRASRIVPRNSDVLLKISRSYQRDENFKMAKNYFAKTIKADRKNVDSYVGLALIAEEERNVPLATKYYKKAQSLDPKDPRPYYYLGFIYKNMNQSKAATLAFKKYLKLDPQSKEKEDIEDQIFNLNRR